MMNRFTTEVKYGIIKKDKPIYILYKEKGKKGQYPITHIDLPYMTESGYQHGAGWGWTCNIEESYKEALKFNSIPEVRMYLDDYVKVISKAGYILTITTELPEKNWRVMVIKHNRNYGYFEGNISSKSLKTSQNIGGKYVRKFATEKKAQEFVTKFKNSYWYKLKDWDLEIVNINDVKNNIEKE